MSVLKERWKIWWQETSVHNKELIGDPTIEINGMNLPRLIWKRLETEYVQEKGVALSFYIDGMSPYPPYVSVAQFKLWNTLLIIVPSTNSNGTSPMTLSTGRRI